MVVQSIVGLLFVAKHVTCLVNDASGDGSVRSVQTTVTRDLSPLEGGGGEERVWLWHRKR